MKTGQGIPIFRSILKAVWCAVFFLGTQTSCQKKPSTAIVVVAVDSLSVSDISCTERLTTKSGLAILCDESVRFTHAFTPSTLSSPAMASLLTGLYPFQHELRHNGAPALASSIETLAESAVKKDYRTGFFSGGAPIFRKTGLNQGFEYFDDAVTPNLKTVFRPFKKSVENFTQWINKEVGNDPYIAYFYVPDLSFIETLTVSPEGEPRSLSYESQLDEFDQQLLQLIKFIQKKNQWRETLFVFTGLNGRSPIHRRLEVPPNNLHNDKTQVPLFIKPPQKVRDTNLSWTIDRDVSLVDVGVMFFDFLGAPLPPVDKDFPSFSLKKSLVDVNSVPPHERPILMESSWAQWRNLGPSRAAAVRGPDYMIWDHKPRVFNTLADRLQLNPLPLQGDPAKFANEMITKFKRIGYSGFEFKNYKPSEKDHLPYLMWHDSHQIPYLIKSLWELHKENPKDTELVNWLANLSLESRDFKVFDSLAEESKNPVWLMSDTDPCWKLSREEEYDPELAKSCTDSLFVDLIIWLKTDKDDSSKEWLRSKVARSYYYHQLDRKIAIANVALHNIWDVSPQLALKPYYIDLFFAKGDGASLRNLLVWHFPRVEEDY